MDSTNPLPLEVDPAAREAAEWFLELQSPELPVDRIIAWQEWLIASDRNRRTFEHIGSAWMMLDRASRPLPWPDDAEVEEDRYDGSVSVSEWRRTHSTGHPAGRVSEPYPATRGPSRVNTWNRAALAAAAIILAVGIGVVARRTAVPNESFVLETNTSENREIALVDGSTVTLGGKSRLSVALGKRTREVTLERGEAFFHVAHDSRRPFIVRTGATSVTAVGTEFDVRLASERLVVAVAEGTVRVQAETSTGPAISDADSTRWRSGSSASVSAGEEFTLTESGTAVMRLVDSHTVAEWREGRLQYLGEPLNAVVSDVSRYVTYKIVVADPTLAALRMTGTISTSDVQSWLQSVEVALPVRVVQIASGGVRLEARGNCCRRTYPPTAPRHSTVAAPPDVE